MSTNEAVKNKKNGTERNGSDDYEAKPKLLSAKRDETETVPNLLSATVTASPSQILQTIDIEMTHKEDATHSKKDNFATWQFEDIPFVSNECYRPRTVFEVSDPDSLDFGQSVIENIMNCLQVRSVHAVYVGATANCKTSSYMKFTIRLLRQSKNTNILVDVRRGIGCSIEFRDEYQAIRNAAVLGQINPQVSCSVAFPSVDIECMQGEYIPVDEGTIERSLLTSITYLDSQMYDTRVLTLQDLLSMTNPTSKETCSAACKLILEKHLKIFEYVVDDIAKKVDYNNMDDDDSEEYLRSLTLNLLGNILSSVSSNTVSESMVQIKQEYASISEVLVWYAENALTCPWNACLAVKCLRLLWSESIEFGTEKIVRCLKKAEEVGKRSHELLKKEAGQALGVMDI